MAEPKFEGITIPWSDCGPLRSATNNFFGVDVYFLTADADGYDYFVYPKAKLNKDKRKIMVAFIMGFVACRKLN